MTPTVKIPSVTVFVIRSSEEENTVYTVHGGRRSEGNGKGKLPFITVYGIRKLGNHRTLHDLLSEVDDEHCYDPGSRLNR